MPEVPDQSRGVLIAAVFCAIIGLIAYAGYLQRGWAFAAGTANIHRAVTTGQKTPTAARDGRRGDGLRAVYATEDPTFP